MLRVLSQGYTAGRVVSVAAGCGCDHSDAAVGAMAWPHLAVLRAFFYITHPTARSQPPQARVPGPSRRDRPETGARIGCRADLRAYAVAGRRAAARSRLCDLRTGHPKALFRPFRGVLCPVGT